MVSCGEPVLLWREDWGRWLTGPRGTIVCKGFQQLRNKETTLFPDSPHKVGW